ncbi:predicted protein [Streptomyces viridosporus ATCC 14672]|uniref:Predicted protein n=1 Tax=Streptomyces viridosporus (strain ATCC 14672 / DSM 40746 / JCM 4963 / KCTC 9882 / NRRL B-12104 / FH 1290) TaxID=566461 RepID=D6A1E8_STRV1|nr:predicted protein [Streptomyces viridosporus ATCC 14672]
MGLAAAHGSGDERHLSALLLLAGVERPLKSCQLFFSLYQHRAYQPL